MYKKILTISALSLSAFFCLTFAKAIDLTKSDAPINAAVPTKQKYAYVADRDKQMATTYGIATLTLMDPAAVTFSAVIVRDGKLGNWGEGTVLYKKDMSDDSVSGMVDYGEVCNPGTTMRARFRNHNYTFNSNQIEGTFRYL